MNRPAEKSMSSEMMANIDSIISFEKLIALALEAGFDAAGALDCATI